MQLRVLLVDDETAVRSAFRTVLRLALPQSEIREASSLAAAREALSTETFDLLISDVVLEEPDAGWQLAREAQARGVPVLLVSGDTHAPERGTGEPVPLVSKMEFAYTNVADLVTCALATQRRDPPGSARS
jgi:DNA-binding NtrC family response regulator